MFPLDAEYSLSDISQDGDKLDSRTLIISVIAWLQMNRGSNQITKYIIVKKPNTLALHGLTYRTIALTLDQRDSTEFTGHLAGILSCAES